MDFSHIPPGLFLVGGGTAGLILQKLAQPAIDYLFEWLKSLAPRRMAERAAAIEAEGKSEERLQHQLEEANKREEILRDRLEKKDQDHHAVQELYHKATIDYTKELGKFDLEKLTIQTKCDQKVAEIKTECDRQVADLQRQHEAEIKQLVAALEACEKSKPNIIR